jgi:hypothetical protein
MFPNKGHALWRCHQGGNRWDRCHRPLRTKLELELSCATTPPARTARNIRARWLPDVAHAAKLRKPLYIFWTSASRIANWGTTYLGTPTSPPLATRRGTAATASSASAGEHGRMWLVDRRCSRIHLKRSDTGLGRGYCSLIGIVYKLLYLLQVLYNNTHELHGPKYLIRTSSSFERVLRYYLWIYFYWY